MPTRILGFLLAVTLSLAGAAASAQPVMRGPAATAPMPETGIAPEAAAKVVEIMTDYTMAVGVGFASGGLLASLFTGRIAAVLITGVGGAFIGNILFARYVQEEYGGRTLGEN